MPDDRSDDRSAAQRRAVEQLLHVAPVVDELGRRFTEAGHELFLVGGSVRDAFLGRMQLDLDFTTDARPEQVKALVAGAPSWDVGIAFGTVGVQVGSYRCEITTYRSDSYQRSSRKPQVSYGDSLAGDLRRRDFTVNAMAVRVPLTGRPEFVDPYGGLDDLAAGRLRTPGPAEESFSDDPLRMLRAVRFVAQLGFTVDRAARSAMTAMADRLEIVSAERIRDELVKLLTGRYARRGVELLVDSGLAAYCLPELPRLAETVDEHRRHKDVWQHTLTVLDQAIALEPDGPDLVLRLAALMHDVGKPKTRSFTPGGGVSFHHHEVVGAQMTRARLTALRFPRAVVDEVTRLVELHLRFHGYADGDWTDSAVRRYVRDAGPLLERLHLLTRSDCTTRNRRKAAMLAAAYDELERRIAALREAEELERLRPSIDGNDIMRALGIGPGRLVGEAWRFLYDLRVERGPMSRDEALDALLRWARERGIEIPDDVADGGAADDEDPPPDGPAPE